MTPAPTPTEYRNGIAAALAGLTWRRHDGDNTHQFHTGLTHIEHVVAAVMLTSICTALLDSIEVTCPGVDMDVMVQRLALHMERIQL